MPANDLTQRERQVLEAVIQSYVETAEPAGSRTIAKKFRLGISAATIRNTMSDLEDRGYLYHPHTSAGRIPTDLAYRVYVDDIMNPPPVMPSDREALERQLGSGPNAIQTMLDRAAQVLGVVTQELGIAAAPSFDDTIVDQLQLLPVSSERILMVLVLRHGAARTIFLEIPSDLPSEAVGKVAVVLNERLSGLTLREIRTTLRERLRDVVTESDSRELINVFLEETDQLFNVSDESKEGLKLGSAQILAEQPEFRSEERMRDLIALTERRDLLQDALRNRDGGAGVTITIGAENVDPQLANFTLVTSTYNNGVISGVIGVMGPTRMSYKKVIALVEHTSRLVGNLL